MGPPETISVAWFPERRLSSARPSKWRRWVNALAILAALLLIWILPGVSLYYSLAVLAAVVIAGGVYARYRRITLLGPVCVHDLLCTGRQGRYRWIRCVYALVLLFVLGWVYASWAARTRTDTGLAALFNMSLTVEEMPRFAAAFFYTFVWVQAVVVVLLTPIYVASSIAAEKEHQTLPHLFATELDDHEIVIGKLVSRLAHLLFVVLCGLPILSFIQFFGGIDPEMLLASFAATLALTVSLAALSIVRSVRAARVSDAVLGTYLWAIGFFFATLLVFALLQVLDAWFAAMIYLLNLGPLKFSIPLPSFGNPLIAVFQIERAFRASGSMATALSQVGTEFILFHLIYAVLLCRWAIRNVRHEALKVDEPKPIWRRTGIEFPPRFRRPRLEHRAPFLWKETHVDAPLGSSHFGALMMFIQLVFGWSLVAFFLIAVLCGADTNGLMRGLGVTLAIAMLFAVAINAASSISRERERQTLDGLLMIPVEPVEILKAKWLAPILSLRPLAWCLAIMAGITVLTGGIHVLALPALVLAWGIYAVFLSGLGMWFSMRFNSLRATSLLVLAIIVFTIVCSLPTEPLRTLVPGMSYDDWEKMPPFIKIGLRPHAALGTLCFDYRDMYVLDHLSEPLLARSGGIMFKKLSAALCGLTIYMSASFFLWLDNLRLWAKLTR